MESCDFLGVIEIAIVNNVLFFFLDVGIPFDHKENKVFEALYLFILGQISCSIEVASIQCGLCFILSWQFQEARKLP